MSGWEEHAVALAGPASAPVLTAPPIPLEQLLASVGRSLGVEWEDLKGASRVKHICRARAVAMAEASTAGYSSVAIGRALGGRHHSTVLHGIKSLAPLHELQEGP